MSELISDPRYWARRLREANRRGEIHHAVFKCPLDRWRRIEAKHREILSRLIGSNDSVLDCGCGWGRLLTLMPEGWIGKYLGFDLSPSFTDLAKVEHPGRAFAVCDMRDMGPLWIESPFDWAVLISVRPMVIRNLGAEEWAKMESEIRRVADRLLYLEYDENDEGKVE